ncbi:hypothetical protein C8R44DRAFT_894779 [Mycena epipterygia]|nr:hypothetical protein C8R44DRAFT_894779 [Mycena epipterygia]
MNEPWSQNEAHHGGFFSNAQQFVVAGGVFISNVTTIAPDVPSNFRTIPLGDVDLRHEIHVDEVGMIHRRQGRPTKRLYSARIDGRSSGMTAAIYQGRNAREEWLKDVQRYSAIRHPNVLQLYAISASSGVYAAIFHDGLNPPMLSAESS